VWSARGNAARRKEGGGIGATEKKGEREREREREKKLGWCADVASAHLGGKNEKTEST
jgi:hypothetical protein